MSSDYWIESVMVSFDEAGITATAQQIEEVAGGMESSHENYDMAHGCDVARDNLRGEHERQLVQLRTELEAETARQVAILDKQLENSRCANSDLLWRIEKLKEGRGDD